MFRDMVCILTGGISSTRMNIFSKFLTSSGSVVLKRVKNAPLFKKKKIMTPSLDESVTHLIVENPKITAHELCHQLECLMIPSQVKVIHSSWVEECAKMKAFINPTDFELNLAQNEIERNSNESLEDLNLKRHHSDDEIVQNNRSKQSRRSEIEVNDLSTKEFEGECQDMGNRWHLLHNYIDGQFIPSLLFRFSPEVKRCNQVIGFDMDGTIITTKSGTTFAKDSSDWKFLYSDIPSQLSVRHQSGAHLLIVSNQNGVNKGHVTVSQLIAKFDSIISQVGVPMDIACAFASDGYRKPRTGAWEFLARHRFVDYATDETTRLSVLGQSTYVGDAAGRPKTRDRSKDFSASDYKMAVNLGIQFETPEQFFQGSRAPIDCDRSGVDLGFSLRDFLRQNPSPTIDPSIFDVSPPCERLEIILLIGPPACGKSTIARGLETSGKCVRVNQDTLKTRSACLKAARAILSSGKSVIVDNTNSNRTQRADWIALAREFNGVTLRCIRIEMPKELCFHMINYRLASADTLPEDRRDIPSVAVHTFYKRVEEPTVSEGFTRVDRIPFVPRDPSSPEAVQLFYSYCN